MSRAFVMIKPDGVARNLIGNIVSRFEAKGLKVIKLIMLTPTKELAQAHYEEHKNKDFFDRITDYISSGPVVAMVIEGPDDCFRVVRKMVGATDPLDAELGSIRGDLAISKYSNIIHASDSNESAEREITLWFQ